MSARAPLGSVGTSVPRLGAERFVQGRAAYTAALVPAGALHVRIVRSPYPRAANIKVDKKTARAVAGVVAVSDGADLGRTTNPTPSRFARERLAGPLDVRSIAVDAEGKSQFWEAHLLGREKKYCQLEKLCNLAAISKPTGFTVLALPVKLAEVSAACSRDVALIEP
jgi:xanthine dehydrogenase molybdopterin-binding subunit B